MLGLHVEIIGLYSDEDQAGLFAGILSTLSLPYKQRACHVWQEAVAAARGGTGEAWPPIELRRSSSDFLLSHCSSHSGIILFLWKALVIRRNFFTEQTGPKSQWPVIGSEWKLLRCSVGKLNSAIISGGDAHSQYECKEILLLKICQGGDKLRKHMTSMRKSVLPTYYVCDLLHMEITKCLIAFEWEEVLTAICKFRPS